MNENGYDKIQYNSTDNIIQISDFKNTEKNDSNLKKYLAIFNDIIKIIDSLNIKKQSISTIEKNKYEDLLSNKLNTLNDSKVDLTLIKNSLNNTLIQHYLTLENINLVTIILKIYHKIFSTMNSLNKFYLWLINDNSENESIFEMAIKLQIPLNIHIEFFNNLFSYLPNDNKFIYNNILMNRVNNIFHLCIKQNNFNLLLFLYEKFSTCSSSNILDIKNKLGMTPLHYAAYYSNKKIIDNLIILGCDLNIKDSKDNTPLHYAIKGGNFSLVKKLIICGAEKHIKNKDFITPLDLAKKTGNISIQKILTKNPFKKVDTIKNKRRDYYLIVLLNFCILLKIFVFLKFSHYKTMVNIIIFMISFFWDFICSSILIFFKLKGKKYSKQKNNKIKNTFEQIFKLNNYEDKKLKMLCPVCKIIRNSNTKHCIICNECIEDWDHHCFWLNVCINNTSHFLFLFFLISLFLVILFNGIIFIYIFKKLKILIEKKVNYLNLILDVFIVIMLLILFYGIIMLIQQFNQVIKNKIIDTKKITTLEELLMDSSGSNSKVKEINEKSDINKYRKLSGEGNAIEFQQIKTG